MCAKHPCLALLVLTCVVVAKSLSFSKRQFLHLYNMYMVPTFNKNFLLRVMITYTFFEV